jgi:hypothetical protein
MAAGAETQDSTPEYEHEPRRRQKGGRLGKWLRRHLNLDLSEDDTENDA